MASGLPSSSEIMTMLRGVHLPANKEAILERAQTSGATGHVLLVLGHLPERDYDSASDIAKGISESDTELKELIPHMGASNVAGALAGITFPATKAELLAKAKENNAEKPVLETIEEMQRKEFKTIMDIGRGIREAKVAIRERLFAEAAAR